jgi:lipoyl(octanoyl) transferase
MYRVDIGTMNYTEALAIQKTLARARSKGLLDRDVLLLAEHPAVFTLGRRGGRGNLNVSEAFLEKLGIGIVQVERESVHGTFWVD